MKIEKAKLGDIEDIYQKSSLEVDIIKIENLIRFQC